MILSSRFSRSAICGFLIIFNTLFVNTEVFGVGPTGGEAAAGAADDDVKHYPSSARPRSSSVTSPSQSTPAPVTKPRSSSSVATTEIIRESRRDPRPAAFWSGLSSEQKTELMNRVYSFLRPGNKSFNFRGIRFDLLGRGATGIVAGFQLAGKEYAIKVVRFNPGPKEDKEIATIINLNLIDNPIDGIVPIHAVYRLTHTVRNSFGVEAAELQSNVIFMDKLNILWSDWTPVNTALVIQNMKRLTEAYQALMSRGYFNNDMHDNNLALDKAGKVFMIDVGGFIPIDKDRGFLEKEAIDIMKILIDRKGSLSQIKSTDFQSLLVELNGVSSPAIIKSK